MYLLNRLNEPRQIVAHREWLALPYTVSKHEVESVAFYNHGLLGHTVCVEACPCSDSWPSSWVPWTEKQIAKERQRNKMTL